jgi:hypothetical protein
MSDPKRIQQVADHIVRLSLKGLQHYSERDGKRGERRSIRKGERKSDGGRRRKRV